MALVFRRPIGSGVVKVEFCVLKLIVQDPLGLSEYQWHFRISQTIFFKDETFGKAKKTCLISVWGAFPP